MISLNKILNTICVIVWTRFGTTFVIVTKYEADNNYANKKCSAKFVENEFFAPSVLICLASTTTAGASIYNRQNKLCYSIKSGYRLDECSDDMVGARMYVKENVTVKKTGHKECPDGWVFLHVSCYKPVEQKETRPVISDKCKTFNKRAHLADIKSAEETAQIKAWLFGTYRRESTSPYMSMIWLGLTYNDGWVWSDGSPVVYKNWKLEPRTPDKSTCVVSTGRHLQWYQMDCDGYHTNGLCELDIW